MMTENKQHLVPEIRFKGFTNGWEQRKVQWLIDEGIIEEPMDGNHGEKHPTASEYVDNGIPFLMAKDIKNGIVDIQKCKFITLERSRKLDKGFAKNGDVLITHKATIGEVAILSELSSEYAVLTPQVTYYRVTDKSRLDVKYLYAYFNSPDFQNVLKVEATQSTRSYIGITGQHKLDVKFPTVLKEQIAIGNFFRTFDDTLTLHKRKLDGLRELKKGYLQQMFPQAGQREPRVRFAGFSGEWQEQKLGELFKERNERSSEGELISVTINSGVIKASELERKDNSSEDKSNYKKVEVGDIAYNSMRMWQGASGISNFAGILSPAYTVIIPDEGVDSLFFSYMFKLTRMLEIFQSFSQGLTSDTWNLKFPLLKEIYVTVPCSNEQAAISKFFRIIDEQITAQAIKLEQLRQLKAAYLQKMFI